MDTPIILTLTGSDRIGIVEEVTRILLNCGGNVEVSHMAHLASEFAILMLVALPDDQVLGLESDMQSLMAQGYKVTLTQASQTEAQAHPGWVSYRVELLGADQEGIVHEVAATMRQQGINIESMDMQVVSAPVSGSPLFNMKGVISVPPGLTGHGWEAALIHTGSRLNVDITLKAI